MDENDSIALSKIDDDEDYDDVVFAEEEAQDLILRRFERSANTGVQRKNSHPTRQSESKLDNDHYESLNAPKPILIPRKQRKKILREEWRKPVFKSSFHEELEPQDDGYESKKIEDCKSQEDLFAKIFLDESSSHCENKKDVFQSHPVAIQKNFNTNLDEENVFECSEKNISLEKSIDSHTAEGSKLDCSKAFSRCDINAPKSGLQSHFNEENKNRSTKDLRRLHQQEKYDQENCIHQTDFPSNNDTFSTHNSQEFVHKGERSPQQKQGASNSASVKRKRKRKEKNKIILFGDTYLNNEGSESVLKTARKVTQMSQIKLSTAIKRRKGRNVNHTPVQIKRAKSIVGSRPKHWNRFSFAPKLLSSVQNESVAEALSQATKTTRLDKSRANQAHKNEAHGISATCEVHVSKVRQNKSPKNKVLHDSNQTNRENSSNDKLWKQFRPESLQKNLANLSSSEQIPDDDPDQDPDLDQDLGETRVSIDDCKHSSSTPASKIGCKNPETRTPHNEANIPREKFIGSSNDERTFQKRVGWKKQGGARGKNGKEGKLGKELRSIRSKISANCVRLRAGSYSFGSHDINDPRNRAEIYMDVTVVNSLQPSCSDPSVSMRRNDARFLIMLGYVHCRKKRLKSPPVSNIVPSPEVPATKNAADENNFFPHFAWICFSLNTIQENNIEKGTKLRIYDYITIAREIGEKVEEFEEREPSLSMKENLPVIICTKLCEPYPSFLPKLSEVPSSLYCSMPCLK